MSIQAKGEHYFHFKDFPISVVRIRGNVEAQHPYDLTDTPHHHDFSELVIVEQGVGVQRVEGVEYPVRTGDVFIFQGDREHCFTNRENLSFINVMFSLEELPLPWEHLKTIPGYHALFVLEPTYRARHGFKSRLQLDHTSMSEAQVIVNAMCEEQLHQRPGCQVLMLSWLMELMVMLSRKYSGSDSESAKALLRIGAVVSALEADYSRQWRLPDMAKEAGMSVNNLLLAFRGAIGTSPINYLLQVRIRKAMEMLRSSSSTISEIAFSVGFSDSNYFSRQFKRAAQLSPREFRRKMHRG